MPCIDDIINTITLNPANVRFSDLCKVCDFYFGDPRQKGSSHRIYKTPWQGDPRGNIQNTKGKAKAYQVHQVLRVAYPNLLVSWPVFGVAASDEYSICNACRALNTNQHSAQFEVKHFSRGP